MNDNIFGKRLKMLRQEINMSRAELALNLNTSISAISQYETGSRIPSDDIKICIAKLFNVSLDYLMGLTSIKNAEFSNIYISTLSELTEKDLEEVYNFIKYIQSKNK